MVSEAHSNLKILFFPFMAQGHMLPMVDMAKLFAARGAEATIFTTPANASLIRPSVESPGRSNPVHLHVVPFPACPGLPDGIENLSAITSTDMRFKFFAFASELRGPFDRALAELAPDCVVTDMFLPWTVDVAAEHGIPRLVFHGTNFFARCAIDSIQRHNLFESLAAAAESESFVLPGLPHEIELLKSQMDHSRATDPMKAELFKRIREAEAKSYGMVANSFHELEPDYIEHYRNVMGKKAWPVGPVSLCNENIMDRSGRGDKAAVDEETCTNWLESKRPGSVVYVCFGSMSDFSAAQVRELALGLEASSRPFILVVRKQNYEMMPQGFEERTKGRSLIIGGWAPQILILNHKSVGCFVTHCGWNSSLEGISAGLPMVTWPLFAEQFFNEKLIVDVLKIGVAVGIKEYAKGTEEREVVGAETIENAVRQVMDGGEEAEVRRRQAKELGEMARRAVAEGGSSYVDMGNLMQELVDRRSTVNKLMIETGRDFGLN